MKILLVEDKPQTAQRLIRVLTNVGHIVTHTVCTLEGAKPARQAPFDVLLLDFNLLDLDGSQASLLLRRELKRKPVGAADCRNSRIRLQGA